jgi:c-di-GMP-binding flagellar brake protein YcgR
MAGLWLAPEPSSNKRDSDVMNLHELVLPIGKPVTLRAVGQDYKEHIFEAQLIGYEIAKVVLLSVPEKPGQVLLHNGLDIEIEIRLPEGQANFSTTIDEVGDWGFRYVKLDYPRQLDYQNPREHIRVPSDASIEVIGHTELGMDTSAMRGQLLDVSTAGARIVLEKELTNLVKEVTIDCHLAAYGLEQTLKVKAVVINQAPVSEDYPELGFGYGLAFKELPEVNHWFLHAYCMEHIQRQRVVIFS